MENALKPHYLPHLNDDDLDEFVERGQGASMSRGVVRLRYPGHDTHRYRGGEITAPTDTFRLWKVLGHARSYRNLDHVKSAINDRLSSDEIGRYQSIEDSRNARHTSKGGTTSYVLYLRISDNVLSEESWSTISVTMRSSRVECIDCVKQGAHKWVGIGIGDTLEDLVHWLSFDSTGSHPEINHEVRMGPTWFTQPTLKRLKEFLLWGK